MYAILAITIGKATMPRTQTDGGVVYTPEEFFRPVYEAWDRDKIPPPEGYSCWMDCLPHKLREAEEWTKHTNKQR